MTSFSRATHKISIAGDLGSGKSSVTKALALALHVQRSSTGDIQRKLAADMGMSTLELNTYADTHPEIDQHIDNQLKLLESSSEPCVIDSRLAWHFVPSSFKVYLLVNPVIAATRISGDSSRQSERYQDISEAQQKILERKLSENHRFMVTYGVDCTRLRNYDLVIDTSQILPQDVVARIQQERATWIPGQPTQLWLSPQELLPTKNTEDDGQLVGVIYSMGRFFIVHGHRRVAAALTAGEPSIHVQLIAQDEERLPQGSTANEFATAQFHADLIRLWEKRYNFTFKHIPLR